MAMTSFERKIIIKNPTAVEIIVKGYEATVRTNPYDSIDFIEEIKRGKDALKRFSSRSKNS